MRQALLCQFHQRFTCAFFVRKCFFHQNLTREKLRKALWYEKCTHKMLMKLTPHFLSRYSKSGDCLGTVTERPAKASRLRWEIADECLQTIQTCLKVRQGWHLRDVINFREQGHWQAFLHLMLLKNIIFALSLSLSQSLSLSFFECVCVFVSERER